MRTRTESRNFPAVRSCLFSLYIFSQSTEHLLFQNIGGQAGVDGPTNPSARALPPDCQRHHSGGPRPPHSALTLLTAVWEPDHIVLESAERIHRQTSLGSVLKHPCSSGDASVSRRRRRWRLLRTGPDKLSLGTRTLCVGRAGTVRGDRLLSYLIPRWRRRRRRRFLFRRCFRRRGCCGWLEWRRPVIRRRRCEVRWRGQMRRRGPIEGLVPVRRRSSVRRHRRRCTRRVGRRAG